MKRYFELDLQKLMEEEDPIGTLLMWLGAPEWASSNLDALYDVLTDSEACYLVKLKGEIPTSAQKIHQVMLDAARENPKFKLK